MSQQRVPPLIIDPISPAKDIKNSAAIIFMHGLGDDAAGFEGIAKQFVDGKKLPYMQWILPNALENRDAMQTAWYTPSGLPINPPSRPELAEDEDEDGMVQSRKYVESLIDELIAKGVPHRRIVVAGFSQGHAMTMIVGLTSAKYSSKLGGLACLCGYMPLVDRIPEMRKEADLPDKLNDEVPIFVMRGGSDRLVPSRFHKQCVEKLKEFGVKDGVLEDHEYQGVAHSVSPRVLNDLCIWLEKVLPPLE